MGFFCEQQIVTLLWRTPKERKEEKTRASSEATTSELAQVLNYYHVPLLSMRHTLEAGRPGGEQDMVPSVWWLRQTHRRNLT